MMLDKQRKAVGDRLERLEQECARSRANKENTSTMSGLTPGKLRSGMKTPISQQRSIKKQQTRTFDNNTRARLFESMMMADNLDPTPFQPMPIDYTKLDNDEEANIPENTGDFKGEMCLPRLLTQVNYQIQNDGIGDEHESDNSIDESRLRLVDMLQRISKPTPNES